VFDRKEKIGIQVFVNHHYLPLIIEMVDNEIDSLYAEINRNTPPITITKEQVRFELFLLFLKTSGYGLSQIKGLDERFYAQLALIVDEYLRTNFADIYLDPKMLSGKEDRLTLSDQYIYYGNKVKAYHEYEQLYRQDKIRKQDFPFIISGIFFAPICDYKTINEPLAIAIGELHKGSLIHITQRLSSLASKYQIIPDTR
jgi:hypothetical protein